MSVNRPARAPIVFVHGLWLHAESWDPWIAYFRSNGYEASAANWPGDADTTAATRANASAVAGFGIQEIADHIGISADYLTDCPRINVMDKALYACDELAGFITAVALMRPNGISDLNASSVKKKLKKKLVWPLVSSPVWELTN